MASLRTQPHFCSALLSLPLAAASAHTKTKMHSSEPGCRSRHLKVAIVPVQLEHCLQLSVANCGFETQHAPDSTLNPVPLFLSRAVVLRWEGAFTLLSKQQQLRYAAVATCAQQSQDLCTPHHHIATLPFPASSMPTPVSLHLAAARVWGVGLRLCPHLSAPAVCPAAPRSTHCSVTCTPTGGPSACTCGTACA